MYSVLKEGRSPSPNSQIENSVCLLFDNFFPLTISLQNQTDVTGALYQRSHNAPILNELQTTIFTLSTCIEHVSLSTCIRNILFHILNVSWESWLMLFHWNSPEGFHLGKMLCKHQVKVFTAIVSSMPKSPFGKSGFPNPGGIQILQVLI